MRSKSLMSDRPIKSDCLCYQEELVWHSLVLLSALSQLWTHSTVQPPIGTEQTRVGLTFCVTAERKKRPNGHMNPWTQTQWAQNRIDVLWYNYMCKNFVYILKRKIFKFLNNHFTAQIHCWLLVTLNYWCGSQRGHKKVEKEN